MNPSEAGETSPGVDFATIDELDPSLANGFRAIYDREVPVEIRTQQGDERPKQGTLELIKVKLCMLGPEDSPTAVRMEVSSEADLFFHYTHIVDEKGFAKIQETQKLVVDFVDYPGVLIRMLNACIKEPHVSLAIFTMYNESEARFDFIQNMEYKFVELMYCSFSRSPDETVQHHITYRYNAMKQKLSLVQVRLQEITNLVKIKNPSLLLQLQKAGNISSNNSTAGSQQQAFKR